MRLLSMPRGVRRLAFNAICILAGSALLAAGAAAAPVTNAPGQYGQIAVAVLNPGIGSSFTVGPDSNVYGLGFGDVVIKYTSTGGNLAYWGGSGRRPGEFDDPQGIATDAAGNVYVADTGNNRIQKFTATGAFVDHWGGAGADPGEFNGPRGIATDPAGNVYVADTGNDRVQKFTAGGAFVAQWGQGTYEDPIDLTVDVDGNVYVLSQAAPKITRSGPTGAGLLSWGAAGTGQGQWLAASGIATANGQVFLAEPLSVQVFLPSGSFLAEFPTGNQTVSDVATGAAGIVYTNEIGFGQLSGLKTFRVLANFGHLSKQKLGSLTVQVSTADLGAEISLLGKAIVRPRGGSKRAAAAHPRFGLKPKTLTLGANQTKAVRLRFLRRKTIGKLKRRIERGKQVSARISATATEPSGALTTQDLVIWLRR
jgi:hypothetical protein